MVNEPSAERDLIEGRPALIMIDVAASAVSPMPDPPAGSMTGYVDRIERARLAVERARASSIPVVFVQEYHRRDLVDLGRQRDGTDDIHFLDGRAIDAVAEEVEDRSGDYHVKKRRHSGFFGTDLEILLRGLGVETLLICGGLTDVGVHYTFVDGHQRDYFCRVVEDCVAGSTEEAHEHALQAMERLQAGARRSLDEVLEAMTAHAADAVL